MNNVLFLDGASFEDKKEECSEVFTKLTDLLGCMECDKESMLSDWKGEAKNLWVEGFEDEMVLLFEDLRC